MEAVAPNPSSCSCSRYGIAVGEIGMAAVKGGVEAGHLRQVGPQLHQGADRGEIVGLVQGCQRNEALKRATRSSSTRIGAAKSGPPWTTRWPTATS